MKYEVDFLMAGNTHKKVCVTVSRKAESEHQIPACVLAVIKAKGKLLFDDGQLAQKVFHIKTIKRVRK